VDLSSDRAAYLALACATGVGPRTCGALVRAFGSPARAVRASASRLAGVPGVGASRAHAIALAFAEADPAAMDAESARAGLSLWTPVDDGYPSALKVGPDPPPAIWVRGAMPAGELLAVAIVGTRGASAYGLRVARDLSAALARAGVVVVSGLARGIDGAAHAGSLSGGGPTVAVLGCGADVTYPPEHAGLADEIAAAGAIVSEHPPGTPPHPGHFPRRNRIVAALSKATVVVEAGLASGALVTARLASEAGRDVLAVPGPIDRENHRGCHRLLRDGATLCEGVDDVLRVIGAAGPDTPPGARCDDNRCTPMLPAVAPPAPGPALVVWNALDRDDALDVDAIALRTGLSPDAVASGLTLLEVDGRLVRVPGVGVRRAR
jgi:DNA processing protein